MEHIILYAIVPIIVVMLAGYISGKKGIFTGDDAKKFNKVVLDYALPAALFVSIADASREMLVKDIKLSIISAVGIMVIFMLVYFVFRMFKSNTGADAAVSALISGSPTIGFLGFAVLEPIFGTTPTVALVVAIVGIVVNAIGIPVGLSLMNASLEKQQPGSTKKESAWKPVIHALEQPVAWAPILAVVWVVVGIPWPAWASPSFDLIKGANASMAVFSLYFCGGRGEVHGAEKCQPRKSGRFHHRRQLRRRGDCGGHQRAAGKKLSRRAEDPVLPRRRQLG